MFLVRVRVRRRHAEGPILGAGSHPVGAEVRSAISGTGRLVELPEGKQGLHVHQCERTSKALPVQVFILIFLSEVRWEAFCGNRN